MKNSPQNIKNTENTENIQIKKSTQKSTKESKQINFKLSTQALACFLVLQTCFWGVHSSAYAQKINAIDDITEVEPVIESNLPFYVFQGRTPNVMMPISVEWPITSAAWRLPEKIENITMTHKGVTRTIEKIYSTNGFHPAKTYVGYFNSLSCYGYNSNSNTFIAQSIVDDQGTCGNGQFAGSALNWATLSTLDLMRYALTGGERLTDNQNETVIGRARIFTFHNDGLFESDWVKKPESDNLWTIGSHTERFPIKVFDRYNISGQYTGGGNQTQYVRNCGTKMYISNNKNQLLSNEDCAKLNTAGMQIYEVRVRVCTAADALARPNYCQKYPVGNYKPVGVLQNKSATSRIGLMGYLNYGRDVINFQRGLGKQPRLPSQPPGVTAADNYKATTQADVAGMNNTGQLQTWLGERIRHLWGGVLRAPNKFLGERYYNQHLNFAGNPLREFDEQNGVFKKRNVAFVPEVTGTESVENGGPNVMGYTNQFGKNNYVETDDLTELTSEAMRYMANKNQPSSPIADPQNPALVRDPAYFKKKWTGAGAGNLGGNLNTALQMHYDNFPIIKSWNWKKDETENLPDEPIRTKCEAQNIPRMIMLSDTNNWHASTAYVNGKFSTTVSQLEDDNVFFSGNLVSALNSYVNQEGVANGSRQITAGALSDNPPHLEVTNNKSSPKYTHMYQNRYLSSAITALANLNKLRYDNQNAQNQFVDALRVKSIMVDVGEPFGGSPAYNSRTKIRTPGTNEAEDCHLFYAGALGSAESFNNFISNFGANACQSFLNARYFKPDANTTPQQIEDNAATIESSMPPGYFYPSNPQKLITNIKRAFEVPFKIKGSFSAGTYGEVQEDRYSLFRFNLNVLQNSNEQTSYLRTLPIKYIVTNQGGDDILSESPSWADNLYKTMRLHANRNIYVGVEPLKTNLSNDQSSQNYRIFNNAAAEFANSATQAKTTITNHLINFLRGDAGQEGILFRKRVILGDGQDKGLLGSTERSSPIVVPKISNSGRELLYITSNDGMLHAISSASGNILFSYMPQNVAGKVAQTALEGYQNAPLFESQLVHGDAYGIMSNGAQKRYKVVAGGFGLGTKGVFALDVTDVHQNTGSFDGSNVLFEFSDKDDPNIGNITGEPEILNIRGSNGNLQSYLAFTSGYSYGSNANRDAYFYLLKLNVATAANARGLGIKPNHNWQLNHDYFKVKIAATGFASNKINNGFTTSQSVPFNNAIIASYFGDLYGNLWKVSDLEKMVDGNGATSPKVTRLYKGLDNVSIGNGKELQPITAKPNFIFSKLGGMLVTFGTGRFLGLNDLGNKYHTPQAIVAVRDFNQSTPYSINNLAQNTMSSDSKSLENFSTKKEGWHLTIPDGDVGMRSVTTPRIINGVLVFSTQSAGDFSTNQCGASLGGVGTLDAETGQIIAGNNLFTRRNQIIGDILVPPMIKSSGNNSTVGGISTGVGMVGGSDKRRLIFGGVGAADDNANDINDTPALPNMPTINTPTMEGVASWREIQDQN